MTKYTTDDCYDAIRAVREASDALDDLKSGPRDDTFNAAYETYKRAEERLNHIGMERRREKTEANRKGQGSAMAIQRIEQAHMRLTGGVSWQTQMEPVAQP